MGLLAFQDWERGQDQRGLGPAPGWHSMAGESGTGATAHLTGQAWAGGCSLRLPPMTCGLVVSDWLLYKAQPPAMSLSLSLSLSKSVTLPLLPLQQRCSGSGAL